MTFCSDMIRNTMYAIKFIDDLASPLSHRLQLTTDGHKPYLRAVENAFDSGIDYVIFEMLYAAPPIEGVTRYSPAQCCGIRTHNVQGNPDPEPISTSYAKRQNLTMGMSMRRFATEGLINSPLHAEFCFWANRFVYSV